MLLLLYDDNESQYITVLKYTLILKVFCTMYERNNV